MCMQLEAQCALSSLCALCVVRVLRARSARTSKNRYEAARDWQRDERAQRASGGVLQSSCASGARDGEAEQRADCRGALERTGAHGVELRVHVEQQLHLVRFTLRHQATHCATQRTARRHIRWNITESRCSRHHTKQRSRLVSSRLVYYLVEFSF